MLAFGLGLWMKFGDVAGMSLNEWGDFVAGAFAPVALLWLVIGYYQHGEELRFNTRALHAQQVELQRQAENAGQLVEATKERGHAERENVQLMRARDVREAAPRFRFGGSSSGGGTLSVTIQNHGAEVRNVKVHCEGPYQYKLPEHDLMPKGGDIKFSILHGNAPLSFPIWFRISFVDGLGNRHDEKFEIPAEGRGFRPASIPDESKEPPAE